MSGGTSGWRKLSWLAESPGHGSGASPFLRPDVARCRLSHSAYIPRTLTSSGFRRHTGALPFSLGMRVFAQIRRRFAWPQKAPPVGFEPTHTAPEGTQESCWPASDLHA